MKKLVLAAALTAAGAFCLNGVSTGHGGSYRGPGDTVPPGGGAPGGGSGPSTPGPSGPSSPGPSGPSSPGPVSPGSPAGSPSGGSSGPKTGAPDSGPDLTNWEFWWGFNKEPYLNLKAAVHSAGVATGSDEFFLGQGQSSEAKDIYRPSEEVIRGTIVPALLNALETERSNDILTGAMIALAKIGDPKTEGGTDVEGFAQVIEKFIADGTQEISETAAVALGILGNETSTPILVDLAFNTEEGRRKVSKSGMANEVPFRTRAFATYGLGLIGFQSEDNGVKQQIVAELVKLLEGDAKTAADRDLGVSALSALGLVRLDSNPDFIIPEEKGALEILAPAELCLESQLAYLLKYYENEDLRFLIRAHCPTAMARLLQSPDPFSQFENLCDEQHHELKVSVASVLVDDLSKHSKKEREIQASAILALGIIGDCDDDKIDEAIRESLIAVPKNMADLQSRYFSLIALGQASGRAGRHGDESLAGLKDTREHLVRQLTKGNTQMKPWAGLAIGVMERALTDNVASYTGSSEMGVALRLALDKSKTTREVGAFSIAAGIMKDEESKKIVQKKLETMSQEETRGHCAIALGLLGDLEAKEQIQTVVSESKFRPELLRSAAIGLGLLGDKELVPDLIEMLQTANSLASQASISAALGFIGDARSIDPLIGMLNDDQITDLARGFAAVALGIVADKEPLPWNAKISTNSNYRANTTTLTGDGGTGILDIL